MANYCDFTCRIITPNAHSLFERLERDLTEADQRNEGLFIGSNRYLFDSQLEVEDDVISLNGYTKWCFVSDEMDKFIKFLQGIDSAISSIKVEYEEGGCLLFGRYHFEDGMVHHIYLDECHFPDFDDDDCYYEQLTDNLSKYGLEESWQHGEHDEYK